MIFGINQAELDQERYLQFEHTRSLNENIIDLGFEIQSLKSKNQLLELERDQAVNTERETFESLMRCAEKYRLVMAAGGKVEQPV